MRKTFQTLMKILNNKPFLWLRFQMGRLWQTAKNIKFLYRQCQGTMIKSCYCRTMRNRKFLSQRWQDSMIKYSGSPLWSIRVTDLRSKKFPQPMQGSGALRLDQSPKRWRRTIKSTYSCNLCKELTNLWEWIYKPRKRSLERSTKSYSDSRRDEGPQLIKEKS